MPVAGTLLLPKRLAQPFEVDARIRFQPPKGFSGVGDRARQLGDAQILENMLRAAMADTLLAAYRKRFLEGLPGAVNMKRENSRANERTRPIGREVRDHLVKAYGAVRAARNSKDPQALQNAVTDLDAAKQGLKNALERKRKARRPLPHGMFRTLAIQILDLMTDTGEIQVTHDQGTITAGIGSIAILDAIKTPSATMALTKHPTASTHDILWRQLEFGTGAFATVGPYQSELGQGNRDTAHQIASGGWWYGRSPEEALHLRGSRPIGALRNPATLLAHDADSLRFYKVFGQLIAGALLLRSF